MYQFSEFIENYPLYLIVITELFWYIIYMLFILCDSFLEILSLLIQPSSSHSSWTNTLSAFLFSLSASLFVYEKEKKIAILKVLFYFSSQPLFGHPKNFFLLKNNSVSFKEVISNTSSTRPYFIRPHVS